MMKKHIVLGLIVLCSAVGQIPAADEALWKKAAENGEQARQTFLHCRDYVRGWLAHADPESGLIPRNLTRDPYWNARDAAADNYPFMVLTSALIDRDLFNGRMREMLESEKRLTSRVGAMPDDFLFETHDFRTEEVRMKTVIFGASEYVKDGLLPLTEWLGPSPWMDRMIALVDSILDHAEIDTPAGPLPDTSHEVGGEMMQTLSRLYWMTKKEEYRDMALRYADYFLLHNHPADEQRLSLDDHGCEVIGGLSEVYLIAAHTDKDRYQRYREPIHRLLDRVLEIGRNENGLFHMLIDPVKGEVLKDELTDNWGYDYNAFLTVAYADDYAPYREAVRFALENVHNHADYPWEGGGADGYADSIESGLNLLNRIPVPSGFDWVDYSTEVMLAKQRDDGIIEGWHGDGNYTRTAVMYALWKTKGCHVRPWRADVSIGAVQDEDGVLIRVHADWPWEGIVLFDRPRHAEYFHLPLDYPRLNQFPEWFTVESDVRYKVVAEQNEEKSTQFLSGKDLLEGYPVQLEPGGEIRIEVRAGK